jgi:voltage-gated potassium channel
VVAVLWLAAIVIFGVVEHLVDPESFDNIWQGMWWATQTVTTVGYGDVVPEQTDGKMIAMVLMVGGLSFFAVITGFITSGFVTAAQERRRASADDPVIERLDRVSAEVEAMRADVARLAGDGGGQPPGG